MTRTHVLDALTLNLLRRVAALAIVATLAACGGGSPTEPPSTHQPTSGIGIAFRDGGRHADRVPLIETLVVEAFDRSRGLIAIDGIGVTITAGPNLIPRGWRVGGRADGPRAVTLAVDPSATDDEIARQLPSIAAHEFHHVARIRGVGYGSTLLEAMVSEGLADHFASDVYAEPLPPWAIALSDPEIAAWIARARPDFDSSSYSHSAWFFGSTPAIPMWTGYTLGYRLVDDYREAHPGSTGASLVNAPARWFRP